MIAKSSTWKMFTFSETTTVLMLIFQPEKNKSGIIYIKE